MKIPERDLSKSAEQQGLFRKFIVQRVDGSDQPGGKHYGCRYFVLDLDHDPHAAAAMRAYAQECATTHPKLSADLMREFGSKPAPQVADNYVPFNADAKCNPFVTQCPRCNNPHNACDSPSVTQAAPGEQS